MEILDKKIYYSTLFSKYGCLLSKVQQEVLDQYFNYDLSLSEIAVEKGISRSAIEDALKKGQAKLEEFENKLKIVEKEAKIIKIAANLKENPKVNPKEEAGKIEEVINNGI